MLARLTAIIEETPLSTYGLIFGLAGVILIRGFLEVFSSPTASGFPPLDATTLVHYALFYIAAYLLFALIVGAFARAYGKAARVVLFGMTILWLPPIIDIVSTAGAGVTMTYLFDAPALLWRDFITFFGPLEADGVTSGIRVEAALMMAGVGWYVFHSTGKLIRALCASAVAYGAMFALISIPALVYIAASAFANVPGFDPLSFFLSMSRDSHLVANALPGNFVPVSATILAETGFNKVMSLLLVPLIALLGSLLAWKLDRSAVAAHVRNVRPLRALHYLLLLVAGTLLATHGRFDAYAATDALALLCLLLAWLSAWMLAVCVNDAHDTDIDAISNPERPLIRGTVSASGMQAAAPLFLAFSLLAAWAAGYYPFIFLLVFTACYYLYSAPPLRLKRVPGLSSLLIGFAFLTALLAGFFLFSPDKTVGAVPELLLFGFLVCYTLAINARDLKDIQGDAAVGVATFPTIVAKRFGERVAFHATGALVALAFLISPLFVSIPLLWPFALLAALLGYTACVRTPYRERHLLLVHLAYFLLAGWLYLFV